MIAMDIYDVLLSSIPQGRVERVDVGMFFTAVLAEVSGVMRCGLAATLSNPNFEFTRQPAVREAGSLEGRPAHELAAWIHSESQTEASIGMAAINALLPPVDNPVQMAAEEYIARHGAGKQVALIGHFPFVTELRQVVCKLWVLELNPHGDDLPASAAVEVVPQADILALTATTLINHTFNNLIALRKPGAKLLLLGPSTPLCPDLFELGVDVLSGSIVDHPEPVMAALRQGGTYRQLRKQGVRLVTLESGATSPADPV